MIWNKYEKTGKLGDSENIIKAKDKKTGKHVIIKKIEKSKNNNINEYFSKIKELLKLKNSINVMEIIDSEDNFYIIMEHCIISLEEYIKIRNNGLSIEETKEVLIQLNIILKELNKENINHKNFKLSNIFISIDKMKRILIKLSDYYLNKDNNLFIFKNEFFSKNEIWDLGVIIYYMIFKEYPCECNNQLNNNVINIELKKSGNNELDDLLQKMLIIDSNKRISWEDYFNHLFFKSYNNFQGFKFPEFNFKNIINKEITFRCKDCTNLILFGILYENEKIKIESRCEKGHYNIENLEDFYERNLSNHSSIECSYENEKHENDFSFCYQCNKYFCLKHSKDHKHKEMILISKFDNYCNKHKKNIISFCITCSIHLCEDCKENHLNHKIVDINTIKFNKNEIKEYEKKLLEIEIDFKTFIMNTKNIYNEFIKYHNNFINTIERFININQTQINLCNSLIKSYKKMEKNSNLNYEIIENIKNLFSFKSLNCQIDKNFHILAKTQKYYSFLNNNYNCILEKSKNLINIDYKITKEEKEYLLTKLKPLNEEKYEFIEKYDEETGYFYYGEIIREDEQIKKNGRGIKLYYDGGGKDFGYFKNGKMNGYILSFYKDGSIQKGNKKNGLNEGFHLYKYSDGLIMQNYYKNGLKEEFRILYYPNGDIEVEEYKNNLSVGYCIKYSLNGEKYEGEIKNKNKNGIGILTTFRSIYEGEWKNNNEEGIGKRIWNNPKEKYEGEFKNSNLDGYGIYFNEDGSKDYEGQYENGLHHGYGVFYHSNGNKGYVGLHENGSGNGFGACYFSDGYRFYIGFLTHGKKNGFGVYQEKPNFKKIGFWKNDKIENGYYVHFNSNGSSYRGFVKNGKFDGFGIYKSNNGDIYEGEFINDKRNGYGIYKYNDGRIYKGKWKNDEKEGYGEMIIVGERIYKGEWKNDFPNGYGMEYFDNSNIFQYGFYQNGLIIEKY